ncbi:molybdate ABC transporter substrate-binding protein [Limnohabitans sp.]|uniref:molybdate ABC transporter substrate-binding protein n=1 Tax=Limnohabitans sp. TaxID=1907725 RepID=UPI0038BB1C5C
MRLWLRALLAVFVYGSLALVHAGEVSVAAAANFTAPMQKIAQAFAQDTGHTAVLSVGATGKFYAQIKHGAPFQVLLAADDETPAKLVAEGLGQAGTVFTYATGRLALWSKQAGVVDDQGRVLQGPLSQHPQVKLALADPRLAPYGAAAVQTLTQLGVWPRWQSHVVQGDNIAQAFQFVATQNALLGFVALSQVWVDGRVSQGSVWVVPQQLHAPLRQDAVLLVTGKDQPAALALMAYLKGERAKAIIRAYGYGV